MAGRGRIAASDTLIEAGRLLIPYQGRAAGIVAGRGRIAASDTVIEAGGCSYHTKGGRLGLVAGLVVGSLPDRGR